MSAESAQSAEREFDLDRWVRNALGGVQQMREAAEGGMTDFEMAVSGLEQLEAGVREIRTTVSSFKRRAESTRGLAIRRRAAGQGGLVQSLTEWAAEPMNGYPRQRPSCRPSTMLAGRSWRSARSARRRATIRPPTAPASWSRSSKAEGCSSGRRSVPKEGQVLRRVFDIVDFGTHDDTYRR